MASYTDRSTAHLDAALADLGAAMFPRRRRRIGVTGGTGFWEMSGERSREMWGMYVKGPRAGMPDWADVRPPIVPRQPRQPKPSSGLDAFSKAASREARRGGVVHERHVVAAARAIGPIARSGELGEGDDFVGAITPPSPRPLGPGGSAVPPTFRRAVDPSFAFLHDDDDE
jgi:hypothetical protein